MAESTTHHETNHRAEAPHVPERSEAELRFYPADLREAEAELVWKRREKVHPDAERTENPSFLPPDTLGLALSGGGIRSATFCLGVLQSLARQGWLEKVDFLSTVSGGGYIGSFLGRMFTREWVKDSKGGPVQAVKTALKSCDSPPMDWLRNNGRYLSPNRGGDAWLAGATVLRNWLAVLTVLLTSVFAVLSGVTLLRSVLWHQVEAYAPIFENPLLAIVSESLWWSPLVWLAGAVLLLMIVPVWSYWLTQKTWSDWRFLAWFHERVSVVTTVLIVLLALFVPIANRSFDWLKEDSLVPVMAIGLAAGGAAALLLFWVVNAVSLRDTYLVRNRLSRILAFGLQIAAAIAVFAVIDSFGQSAYAFMMGGEADAGIVTALLGLIGSVAAVIAANAQKITALLQSLPGGKVVRIPATVIAGLVAVLLAGLLLTAAATSVHAVAWRGKTPMPVIEKVSYDPGAEILAKDEPGSPFPTKCSPYSRSTGTPALSARDPATIEKEPQVLSLSIAFGVTVLMSFFIGQILAFFNLSSLHAFYSARLSRAYLGASNPARWGNVDDRSRVGLFRPSALRIGDPDLNDDCPWPDYEPWLNGGPLHIVNTTLNETLRGKSQVEYRDRKGLIMAVGPCGISVGRHDHALWGKRCPYPGPRKPGRDYLSWITALNVKPKEFHALGLPWDNCPETSHGIPNQCERATLSRYVAISGAAITTGLGERTSFGTSLLMGLFNVRLGYWWTSGISYRERKNARTITPLRMISRLESALGRLFPLQAALLSEFTARFYGPLHHRWYLSDGGHYENTGLYELIRRRVPMIIACDCGCDPTCEFGDISNLARKVRIDFGAEFEFIEPEKTMRKSDTEGSKTNSVCGDTTSVAPTPSDPKNDESPSRSKHHALLAWVGHEGKSFNDSKTTSGRREGGSLILFLKPSLTGDEPIDVLQYQARNPDFPNQTTADQFFDEAQWESYRKLGEHVGDKVLSDDIFAKHL